MSSEIVSEDNQAAESTWSDQAATAFAGGNGSESTPYLISNGAQLAFMAKVFNDESGQYVTAYNRKHYLLTNNIDLEKREWTPIGDSPFGHKVNTCFFFDGGDYTISGLMISKPEQPYSGLFGYADGDSVIKNLNIANGNVTGLQKVGGIIGRMKGRIENCTFSGQVTGKLEVGGIVGSMSYGSICNCTNTGTVKCDSHGAGISGSLSGYVQNCSNMGTVDGVSYIGGIAGSAKQEGCIEAGENSGVIKGKHYVGGIAGQAGDLFLLTYCLNNINISGNEYVGGIVGQAGLVRFSCNQGNITGTEIIGGICGAVKEVDDCQNKGCVNGAKTKIGGIAGVCANAMESFNIADIQGNGPIGGIIGICEGELVNDCYNTGNISGTGILGGIVGMTVKDDYVISDCCNAGNLSETWAYGAILGRHDRSYTGNAKIDTSFYLKGCVESNG